MLDGEVLQHKQMLYLVGYVQQGTDSFSQYLVQIVGSIDRPFEIDGFHQAKRHNFFTQGLVS